MIEDSEVCNFADDNTIYAFDDSIEAISRLPKGYINNALEWFKYKPNGRKSGQISGNVFGP